MANLFRINRMETRQIELSLDTAKRWYEQGGELRDLAIGAFGDKMLIGDRLPKTWDEYCIKHGEVGDKIKASLNTAYMTINRYVFSDCKQAQAHIAKMKLHLLRNEYRQGWRPDWNVSCYKYGIKWDMSKMKKELMVAWYIYDNSFLSFPTEEIAREFIANFRELIEQAGDLI